MKNPDFSSNVYFGPDGYYCDCPTDIWQSCTPFWTNHVIESNNCNLYTKNSPAPCECSATCFYTDNTIGVEKAWYVSGCSGYNCGSRTCSLRYLQGRRCDNLIKIYGDCIETPKAPPGCFCKQQCIRGVWRPTDSNCGKPGCGDKCEGAHTDTCSILEELAVRSVACSGLVRCQGSCTYYFNYNTFQWVTSSSSCAGPENCRCPDPGFFSSFNSIIGGQPYISLPCIDTPLPTPVAPTPVAPTPPPPPETCTGNCRYFCSKETSQWELFSSSCYSTIKDGNNASVIGSCACPSGGPCDVSGDLRVPLDKNCVSQEKDGKNCSCLIKCTYESQSSNKWRVVKEGCKDCGDTCAYDLIPNFSIGAPCTNLGETANIACLSKYKDPQEDKGCGRCAVICNRPSRIDEGEWVLLNGCADTADPLIGCFCGALSLIGTPCYNNQEIRTGNCINQNIGTAQDTRAPIVLSNDDTKGTVKLSPIVDGVITINAIPKDGYELSGWTGDISGKNKETQFLVVEDMDITAVFNATPDLGQPKPKITFQVNLISENDFNSTLLSRVPKKGQTLSDFDMNINSRSLNIPGVDGTFKHGDLVIVYGKDAEQLKRTYDKGGPFDTLKVASINWDA